MSYVHILRDRAWYRTPAWATHERFNYAPDCILHPPCCYCRMRADETVASIRFPPDWPDHVETTDPRWSTPHPAWDRDREAADWWMSWYEPEVLVECAPGFGCKANPRRRWGADGRRAWLGLC